MLHTACSSLRAGSEPSYLPPVFVPVPLAPCRSQARLYRLALAEVATVFPSWCAPSPVSCQPQHPRRHVMTPNQSVGSSSAAGGLGAAPGVAASLTGFTVLGVRYVRCLSQPLRRTALTNDACPHHCCRPSCMEQRVEPAQEAGTHLTAAGPCPLRLWVQATGGWAGGWAGGSADGRTRLREGGSAHTVILK
jgi:hypothetical protein